MIVEGVMTILIDHDDADDNLFLTVNLTIVVIVIAVITSVPDAVTIAIATSGHQRYSCDYGDET